MIILELTVQISRSGVRTTTEGMDLKINASMAAKLAMSEESSCPNASTERISTDKLRVQHVNALKLTTNVM